MSCIASDFFAQFSAFFVDQFLSSHSLNSPFRFRTPYLTIYCYQCKMKYIYQTFPLLSRILSEITDNDLTFCFAGELDANRPVPFRLAPNMCELISPVGVSGIITHCMIAVARCLVQPQFSIASYFKAILKDEMLTWHKKVTISEYNRHY